MVPESETQTSEKIPNWLDRGFILFAGILFGWLGLYLSIVRPMNQQLITMNKQLKEVQSSMVSLVGERDDLYKTNDLLTLLKQQQKHLGSAQESFAGLTQVRNEIANLKHQLLQDQTQLTDVKKTLNQFATLKQEILEQSSRLADMHLTWNELKTLQQELLTSRSTLTSMMNTWHNIQTLHQELNSHHDTVKIARNVSDTLLGMEKKLSEKTPDMLTRADETLNQLVEFQVILDQQSQLVPQSLRNMETLGELEIEVAGSIKRVQNMRRDLLDIALLEQSVKDALRVLTPVMELTNAKRLNINDVREVARNLEERRHTLGEVQPSLVSHQGSSYFEFKPSTQFYWEESLIEKSEFLNSTIQTPVLDESKTVVPPTVDMPE